MFFSLFFLVFHHFSLFFSQQETRKDEFLSVSKQKIDSLKKRIKEGEKELEILEQDTLKLKKSEDLSKKQEIIEQLEKEKVAKLDMRNRALKDYEIYYSEFEEIKEKDNSLMENLKKNIIFLLTNLLIFHIFFPL